MATVAVLSLGVSIGVSTVVFSVVHHVFYRPLPAADPDRLVILHKLDTQRGIFLPPFYSDATELQERSDLFEGAAVVAYDTLVFIESGVAEEAPAQLVPSHFFELLGMKAARGRLFSPRGDELPDAEPVAVVSERFWKSRLGGDPNLIGRTLRTREVYLTVVGIVPEGFDGIGAASAFEIWVPLRWASSVMTPSIFDCTFRADGCSVSVVARLKDGVTDAAAQASLGPGVDLVPLREDLTHPRVRYLVVLLTASVGLVLLLACANVANVLLSLGEERQKETAIRAACGAGRGQLIRQSVGEGMVLALSAGLVGVCLAFAGTEMLTHLRPQLPFGLQARVNLAVLGFNFAIAAAAGFAVAVAPVLALLRRHRESLTDALKGGPVMSGLRRAARTGTFLNDFLASTQIAIAVALLIGTSLTVRSFLRLNRVRMITAPHEVLVTILGLPEERYPQTDRPRLARYARHLLERVQTVPGVDAADVAVGTPVLAASAPRAPLWLDDGRHLPANEGPRKSRVGPEHFRVLGLEVLRGREFSNLLRRE
jgi:predicted permease